MHFRFVRPGAVVFLVAVWLLLWGSITVANVLSGLVIAVVLLAALPMRPGARRHVYFRPLPFLALSWYFVRKLIESNVALTREVVTSGDGMTTAIIAVPVRGCSDFVITSIANVTALTPGTMVVEMTTIPPVLYLHVLHVEREAKIRADVAKLNSITVHAFGSPFDIESLELPDPAYGSEVPPVTHPAPAATSSDAPSDRLHTAPAEPEFGAIEGEPGPVDSADPEEGP